MEQNKNTNSILHCKKLEILFSRTSSFIPIAIKMTENSN